MRKRLILLFASATLIAALPLQASSFLTGDVPNGITTSINDTNAGLTAYFSSSPIGAGFLTFNPDTGFFTWGPEALVSVQEDQTLTVSFYTDPSLTTLAPISWISFNFGTAENAPLQLTALLGGAGGTTVGTTNSTGTLNPFSFYEGTFTYSAPGAGFDTIELSVPTGDTGLFGIGNLTDAPEPGFFLMFPAVGVAFAWLKRRK